MEVLLSILLVGFLLLSLSLYKRNSRLSESSSALQDYLDKALEDHKLSEQELQITNSKLEMLKSSALTPENAVTKSMHESQMIEKAIKIVELKSNLEEVTEKYEKVRGKAISERVRLGHVSENFAAFLDEFPYDRSKVKALFQPIDLIYFGEDEVVFIDVKSGGSQLSTKQRNIKKLIEDGKVRFEVHRIDDTGYIIK